MMTLGELLRDNKDAIVERWLEDALAAYLGDSAAAFKHQKDPFANPVGHSLRVGTRGIFEALLDEADAEKIRKHLHEIIRIRAVQQLSASQAVCFVFRLKEAVRAELGKASFEPRFLSELTELECQIDQIALDAFDVYVQCREQVCDLRVNEAKRRVSWIVDKLNKHGSGSEFGPDGSGVSRSVGVDARREGLR